MGKGKNHQKKAPASDSGKRKSGSAKTGGVTLKKVKGECSRSSVARSLQALIAITSLRPGENFYRDAKAASKVKMLNGGKAVRDRDGKIIQSAAFQKTEAETEVGRVQADRRWFGEASRSDTASGPSS